MNAGARTPEELDTLLEDAFLLRDRAGFDALFTDGAVLKEAGGLEARGADAIGRALAQLWARDCTYVARSRRVLQTRDTALVVADAGIHVLRRGGDGTWRAAISLLDFDASTRPEDP
ncbi:MAG: nuclear transport factor 2 family protein [Solirubrobacterales bacterium]|nr:nuclear transport factor 2 family protein [Solirubrobacterales bacterium]